MTTPESALPPIEENRHTDAVNEAAVQIFDDVLGRVEEDPELTAADIPRIVQAILDAAAHYFNDQEESNER